MAIVEASKLRILVLLLCCAPLYLWGTHIVGGELNYRCLGNDQYEVSLTVFRDCYNGQPPFDPVASIGVYDLQSNLLLDVRIPFMGDDTLQPVLFDSCLAIPPTVCVHRTTYLDTLLLPYRVGGYRLVYQRCCRNGTIANLINPGGAGASFYTFITEQGLQACNSNPVFNEWPPIYICNGTPILFDHSALDADGDSLVYELNAPFDGATLGNPMPQPPNPPRPNTLLDPYDTVQWALPYSTLDMMGGVPLTIDRQTGLLTGTPQVLGQFVVGVSVKEYRNGQLIGITRRDFQYNVGTCEPINAARFSAPAVVCDGYEVTFSNNSSGSVFQWDFGVDALVSDTSTLAQPTFTYPDTGVYLVTLISGVGTLCPDTARREVYILGGQLSWATSAEYDPCQDTVTVQFYDETQFSVGVATAWQWDFVGAGSSTLERPTAIFAGNPAGVYYYRMQVTASNGCTVTGIDSVVVHPVRIDLAAGPQDCPGLPMTLTAVDRIGSGEVTYRWWPTDAILSGLTDSVATAAPVVPTTFILETSRASCLQYDTLEVDPTLNAPPLALTAQPDTIWPGDTVQLIATYDATYQYAWSPTQWLRDSTGYTTSAQPLESITYSVTVTDTAGCVAVAQAPIVVRPFACELPYLFVPNAFTPDGDGHNDVLYVRANALDRFHFMVYNRWGQRVFETSDLSQGWDGTFQGQRLPPDVYGYYLVADCINGEQQVIKGNVALIW